MKKIKYIVGLMILAFIGATIASVAADISLQDVYQLIPGAGIGASYAMGAVVGTTVTTDKVREASADLLTNTISKKITEIRPHIAPLDTIMRHTGIVVPIKSWRTDYYAVDIRGVNDEVDGDVELARVDGSWPEQLTATVKVNNIGIWSVDDNVLFLGVAGTDKGLLVGHVYDIHRSHSNLEVLFLNLEGIAGADLTIDDETKILRIGNSKAELDAQTSPYAMMPQKAFNYAQIHMAQVEQSIYDKLHDKEVNWDISDYQSQSLYDLRRSMEFTSLFGYRTVKPDPNDPNRVKHFSGGLVRYITKGLEYNDVITNDLFVDWSKQIFTGNSGSEKRFVFVDSNLMAAMSKVPTIEKQIEAKQTEVVYGITFKRVETNFGSLMIYHHPLLHNIMPTGGGIVLDMNNIEKHVFKPMDVRELELDKSGQRRANAYVVDEAFCYALRYPDTHAIIANLGALPSD